MDFKVKVYKKNLKIKTKKLLFLVEVFGGLFINLLLAEFIKRF